MNSQLNARASLLFLVFVVLGVYYPAIFSPFNSVDDPGTINYLLNLDSFNLREIFTPGGNYYRPLLMVTFLADKYLWGLQESFMHLENIVFHLLNVLLLFAVARRGGLACGVRSVAAPLTAALLFAVHPINAESVNWISGRTDPLACLFILLSTFLLLKTPLSPRQSLLAALSMLAACLAKETAIFFLPAALLLPFFHCQDGMRRSLRETVLKNWFHLLVFLAAGAGFFAFRTLASHNRDAGVSHVLTHLGGAQSAAASVNFRLPLKAAGFYLKKLVMPFPLNFGIIQVSDLYLPIGILLCLLVVLLLTRRTLAAYFFICAACISCSALMIPLLNLTWTPLAERYMYIPSAFFVMGVTFAVERWEHRARFQWLVSATVILVLIIGCYGTASRTLLWQDNLALFRDTIQKSPGFVPAQNEIAIALYARGDKRQAAEVMTSMQLPASLINYQYGLITKSAALLQKGDMGGALAFLQQALKDPGRHEADICRRILAVYQMQIEKKVTTSAQVYPDSVRLLSRIYQLTGDPFYLYRLGITHIAQKKRTLARQCFQSAAVQSPQNAIYRLPSIKLSEKLSH